MTSQWNARFADLICGLLHPGPLSLQKSKEDSFALMYSYSTYSIVTFYNIIQHQSLSTVCLTLIRSLSPFSNSATRWISTATACFKLLTIELGHPNISLEIKTSRCGMTGIWWDMCVQLWSIHTCRQPHLGATSQHGKAWPPAKCPKAWKAQRFDWKRRRCFDLTGRFGLDRWHRQSM